MNLSLEPLTMEAAARFWRDKVLLGPGRFSQLSDEAKIRAFGVAGIARGDELTTVFNSLQAAIEKGISFSKFKKDCAEIFARRGWSGKREWRVQNIFRTNIQTAYNSGRWQKQKELAEAFPYLQYNAVNDRRTRPTHKAMDGKVFPIDHPFWDTWYPPNGYRCRCSTLSLTAKQLERLGLQVETEDPTNTAVAIPNPVTGEKLHVQQLLPDPGFNHHPGKVVWGGLGEGKTQAIYRPMEDLPGPANYNRPPLANVRAIESLENDLLPTGMDEAFYRQEFNKRFGEETVLKDASGEPVIISFINMDFSQSALGETIPLLRQIIEKPYEIWLTPEQDQSGRIRLAKRYVGLWKTKEVKRAAVFEVVNGLYQGVTTFISLEGSETDFNPAQRQRLGLLLYPKR